MESPYSALEAHLERDIARLARRTQPVRAWSNRLAFMRLAIVGGGIVLVVALAISNLTVFAWGAVVLTVLAFAFVAREHRRVDTWLDTLDSARRLRQDTLARLRLEWDELAPPKPLQLNDLSLARDLDLTGYRSLHHLLDTTLSRRGTQLLAEWLTNPRPDVAGIQQRQGWVRELRVNPRLRERFALTYRLLLKRELEGDALLAWLKGEFPSRQLRRMLLPATILVFLNLAFFLLWSLTPFPPLWIGTLVAYFALYYWNRTALDIALGGLVRVHAELDKLAALLRTLERAHYDNAPRLAELCAPLRQAERAPSRQLRRVGWITAAVGLRSNPLLALGLNLILPWDFWFAVLADSARREIAEVLPTWLDTVHTLDALVALGNYAARTPDAQFPEFRADATPPFRARELAHPLLPHAARIKNDFVIEQLGQVDLLTGSNMAGKSTFLKTVGVNLCLGYAGAPVLAAELCSQPFRLHTCIRITDSISDGFSFFYAEVKCLRALLDALQAPDELPLLYLIDEIFRGTNNRERLIGSRAYVQALMGARGAGLIATHDLELARIAEQDARARNLHFRDEVSDGRLVFDYRLREGPSPTTNALRIMELEGLPTT